MKRRSFITQASLGAAIPLLAGTASSQAATGASDKSKTPQQQRAFLQAQLLKVAEPVLVHQAAGTLDTAMPIGNNNVWPGKKDLRLSYRSLESFARVSMGMGAWLKHELSQPTQQAAVTKTHGLLLEGLTRGVSSTFNFDKGEQPLVDAAILAFNMLLSPSVFYEPLPATEKLKLIAAMKKTRVIKPFFNNWLLFAAMVETWLHSVGEAADVMRIDYALKQHEQWYVGDAWYKDGPSFHLDYYNSLIIHPFLRVILEQRVQVDENEHRAMTDKVMKRNSRHAEQLVRMVALDGSYPLIGRSICYRAGVFHHLAFMGFKGQFTDTVTPVATRETLYAVIARLHQEPKNLFTTDGWLQMGVTSSQPALAENYITTASLYLHTAAFMLLGLAPSHELWTDPRGPETTIAGRLQAGDPTLMADKALKD